MAEMVRILLNGLPIEVQRGTSIAAALVNAGVVAFRTSVSGEPRQPLCGMGICHECRAQVNGVEYVRTCMILCEDGMEVEAGG